MSSISHEREGQTFQNLSSARLSSSTRNLELAESFNRTMRLAMQWIEGSTSIEKVASNAERNDRCIEFRKAIIELQTHLKPQQAVVTLGGFLAAQNLLEKLPSVLKAADDRAHDARISAFTNFAHYLFKLTGETNAGNDTLSAELMILSGGAGIDWRSLPSEKSVGVRRARLGDFIRTKDIR